jgi:hypothetical protein
MLIVDFLCQHNSILDHLIPPPHNLYESLGCLAAKMVYSRIYDGLKLATYYFSAYTSYHPTSTAFPNEKRPGLRLDLRFVCISVS